MSDHASSANPFHASACMPTSMACQLVSGALSGDDCLLDNGSFYDVWTYTARAGESIRITMEAGFDTVLSLYGPDGALAASNDNFGGTTNSQIAFTLDASGDWVIFATSHDPLITGFYRLDVTCTGGPPPPECTADVANLCLNSDRFRVEVVWRVPAQGTSGIAPAVPLTSDTGYFWFFSSNNIELVIKVVDGRSFNGYYWVFYGALSDVEYTIIVTDTVTDAVKTYTNPQGRLASVADVVAFPGDVAAAARSRTPGSSPNPPKADFAPVHSSALSTILPESATADCFPDATTLCLNNGRFQVRVAWRVPTQGTSGQGQAVRVTSDTGYFWFFSSNNVELMIKAVDGRVFNGYFWVFYGALSDVEYTITVTDSVTGAVKTYVNQQGQQASIADTAAFQ